MKYILTDLNELVIFSPTVNHDRMAQLFDGKPKSAGFLRVEGNGMVQVYGESITLNLTSSKADEPIIREILTR